MIASSWIWSKVALFTKNFVILAIFVYQFLIFKLLIDVQTVFIAKLKAKSRANFDSTFQASQKLVWFQKKNIFWDLSLDFEEPVYQKSTANPAFLAERALNIKS